MKLFNIFRRLCETLPGGVYVCGAILALVGAVPSLVGGTRPEVLLTRDFIQDQLLATALVRGENPYEKVPVLLERYHGVAEPLHNDHPSPHPMAAAFLALPTLPFGAYGGALLNAAVSIFVVFLAVALTLRRATPLWAPISFFVSGLCFTTISLETDLFYGTVSPWLLLGSILLIEAAEKKNDRAVGLVLGLLLALRFFGWPIAVLLFLQRQYRPLLVAGATFLGVQVATLAAIGPEVFVEYFRVVLPEVSGLWRLAVTNYSLWTLWPKVLEEVDWRSGLAIYNAPAVGPTMEVTLLSALTVVGVVALCAFAARRQPSRPVALASMILLSVVATPMLWGHNLVLLIVPVLIGAIASPTLGIVGIFFFLGADLFPSLYSVFAARIEGAVLPTFAAIASVIPAAMVTAWAFLLARHRSSSGG